MIDRPVGDRLLDGHDHAIESLSTHLCAQSGTSIIGVDCERPSCRAG